MLLPVSNDSSWGYIDESGRLVIPFQFSEASPFSDGLARVSTDGGFGEAFIDESGELAIPGPPKEWQHYARDIELRDLGERNWVYENFSEGMAAIKFDPSMPKVGFINQQGKLILPTDYRVAYSFSEGLAFVETLRFPQACGFIDKLGSLVVELDAEAFTQRYSQGRARFRDRSGQWGFFDEAGDVVIEASFTWAEDFKNGRACVTRSGKCGFVNLMGELVVPLEYDTASSFSNGVAAVAGRRGTVLIDINGEVVAPIEPATADLEIVDACENGFFRVCTVDGKYGVVDSKGKLTVATKYDELDAYGRGFFLVRTDDHWAYLNASGETIWEQ